MASVQRHGSGGPYEATVGYSRVVRAGSHVWVSGCAAVSEDGVVVPIIAIDKHTGKLESQPEIVTRGLMSENGQELLIGAREVLMKTVAESSAVENSDWGVIKEKIRVDLKRYINKQTSKRPLILPVILEV